LDEDDKLKLIGHQGDALADDPIGQMI